MVVPPRDPKALVGAIAKVLDDSSLASRISEGARESSRRFDIQTFVDKMSKLYEILVNRYRELGSGRPQWDYARDFTFLDNDPGKLGNGSARENASAAALTR